jgi:plasmid maintenance system antidote protein VapI
MDIYEIRLKNARALREEAGGPKAFAEKIGREFNYVSRIIGPNPTKTIGFDMARHIEQCFKKPENWLDTPHYPGVSEQEVQEMINIYAKLTKQERESAVKMLRALVGDNPDK